MAGSIRPMLIVLPPSVKGFSPRFVFLAGCLAPPTGYHCPFALDMSTVNFYSTVGSQAIQRLLLGSEMVRTNDNSGYGLVFWRVGRCFGVFGFFVVLYVLISISSF